MSEFLSTTEDLALQSIAAAVAAGVRAQPAAAAATVVASLTTSFGPVIQQIVDLIKSGLSNLPAILAALQSAGVTLPSWASIVVSILLALQKPAN